MGILLIAFGLCSMVAMLLTIAFCRSAALADRKLESLQVRRATELHTAITRPTPKRNSAESADPTLSASCLFPQV
jgi:hypothetical protein